MSPEGQQPPIQVAAEKPGGKLVKNRFFTKVCAIMFPTRRRAGEPRGVLGDKPGWEPRYPLISGG